MRVDDKLGFLMPVILKFSTAISFSHVIGCAKFGSETWGMKKSELDGKGVECDTPSGCLSHEPH